MLEFLLCEHLAAPVNCDRFEEAILHRANSVKLDDVTKLPIFRCPLKSAANTTQISPSWEAKGGGARE